MMLCKWPKLQSSCRFLTQPGCACVSPGSSISPIIRTGTQTEGKTHRPSTPLTPHAGQAFRGPAGLLTCVTLGVGGQVPLPPVVILDHVLLILSGDKGGTLLAVGDREVLTLQVDTVFTDFTSDGVHVSLNPSPADAAELPLEVHALRPAVRNWVLDDIGCNCGTG